MAEHPTPEELDGFVWSWLPSDRAHAVQSHLASGCSECRTKLIHHLKGQLGWAQPPEPVLSPQQSAAYDAAIDRAFSTAVRKAEELLQKRKGEALALLMESEFEALPEAPLHLRGVPLVEALLERSWSLRHENPQEMVRLADWARLLAERLEPGELPFCSVTDLRCRAWIELANAYRVADELDEAESALGRATELLLGGIEDQNLVARFLDVQASIYGTLRLFDLAQTALDLALEIHRRRGDKHLEGRALISKSIYSGYLGESKQAVLLLQAGLKLVDQNRDPRLVYLAFHNLARLLLDCGRPRDARVALFNLKARNLESGGRVTELKLRWVEAQINVGLGELDRAERALLEVKQGFEEAELGYKAALATLELAAVMLQRGRAEAATREVLQAVGVFEAVGVQREAKASLLLLRKAFEQQVADAKLLQYVIGMLRGGEGATAARLEAPGEES